MKAENNVTIIIKENVLVFKGNTLQLSNISNIRIDTMPKKPYPTWVFIVLLIGIIISNMSEGIAALFIIVSLGLILYITLSNFFRGIYLGITMNSGESFFFSGSDNDFLYKAAHEISTRMNEKGQSVINFENCRIDSSQIANNNSQYYKGGVQ